MALIAASWPRGLRPRKLASAGHSSGQLRDREATGILNLDLTGAQEGASLSCGPSDFGLWPQLVSGFKDLNIRPTTDKDGILSVTASLKPQPLCSVHRVSGPGAQRTGRTTATGSGTTSGVRVPGADTRRTGRTVGHLGALPGRVSGSALPGVTGACTATCSLGRRGDQAAEISHAEDVGDLVSRDPVDPQSLRGDELPH